MGELKQGSDSHIGTITRVRGETLKAESETADLWQPKWNENQTVLAAAILTLDRNTRPLKGAEAGSWSLGIVEQPQARAAVDCRETDLGDVREETVVGKACGGKPDRQPWEQAILLSHTRGWSHHHSRSPHR